MPLARKTFALGALLPITLALPALADPPSHAPAHGWRKKHPADYVGYTGERWENDYEVSAGRCNREAVGAAIGGVVGGVVGSRVASPENRVVATIIGATAGALLGAKVAHALDDADRGCFGHALEIASAGHRVVWTNDAVGVRYELSPGAARDRDGRSCRAFTLVEIAGRRSTSESGIACRVQAGVWRVAG